MGTITAFWPQSFDVDPSKGLLALAALLLAVFLHRYAASDKEKFPTFILIEGYLIGLCLLHGGLASKIV